MKKKTQHVLGGNKEKNGHITTYMKTKLYSTLLSSFTI